MPMNASRHLDEVSTEVSPVNGIVSIAVASDGNHFRFYAPWPKNIT